MPQITITIPAAQVLPVLDGLLTLYSIKAETLKRYSERYMDEEIPNGPLQADRGHLAAIDAAIEQIGWDRVPRHESATVTTEHAVIAAAVQSMLSTAADRLSEVCDEHDLPDGDLSPILEALTEATAGVRLLQSVDEAAQGAPADDDAATDR